MLALFTLHDCYEESALRNLKCYIIELILLLFFSTPLKWDMCKALSTCPAHSNLLINACFLPSIFCQHPHGLHYAHWWFFLTTWAHSSSIPITFSNSLQQHISVVTPETSPSWNYDFYKILTVQIPVSDHSFLSSHCCHTKSPHTHHNLCLFFQTGFTSRVRLPCSCWPLWVTSIIMLFFCSCFWIIECFEKFWNWADFTVFRLMVHNLCLALIASGPAFYSALPDSLGHFPQCQFEALYSVIKSPTACLYPKLNNRWLSLLI